MTPIKLAYHYAHTAVCFVNNKPDTTICCALTAATALELCRSNTCVVPLVFLGWMAREAARCSVLLTKYQNRMTVKKESASVLTGCAFGACSVISAQFLSSPWTVSIEPTLILAGAGTLLSAIGFHKTNTSSREILSLYFDPKKGMWDAPGKNKSDGNSGGGKGGMDCLKDSVDDFMDSLRDKTALVPVPVPVKPSKRGFAGPSMQRRA